MIQVKQIGAFVGGCMFVLALASCSSTTSAPKIDPSVKYSQKDNAFYERNVNAAFNHARAAEVAGSQSNNALLVHHAQIALAEVKEAQRAGSNTPLDDAMVSLTKALEEGQKGQTQEATQNAKDAREKLSHAADVGIVDSNNKTP
ncbi:MAG TPA: small metal-binding protein SmbP [Nitrospira sp.]|nr:small metal-binding protein SmbP [Nitrospira sp.]